MRAKGEEIELLEHIDRMSLQPIADGSGNWRAAGARAPLQPNHPHCGYAKNSVWFAG